VTSPEMNHTGNSGYGAGSDSGSQGAGSDTPSASGRTDDVSFARNLGVDQASDNAGTGKNAVDRGISSAQDAMSQLQQKASELTSSMLDRVNVDELTQKLEEQVRDHPTRTLMMAVGAGFLLGRAAKK
jgi:ElaB/YqjD/DUF883 family membrane-anchored ribosome-binding protein